MQYMYIRFLVETYYDIQHIRIQSSNRLSAYKRAEEQELESRLSSLSDFVKERMQRAEVELKAMVSRELKSIPIASDWLLEIKGIGPCIAGGMIAYIETPTRFETISKLWKYAGQHTKDGYAEKRTRGQKICWNPNLKRLCWLAGESFVKTSTGPYRSLYEQYKSFYKIKYPEPVKTDKKSKDGKAIQIYTPGHIHAMAKRKVVKVFLANLWVHWREIEGASVDMPYVIAHQKTHSHYIDPTI